MSKRPACPPGASWVMPFLTVKDAKATQDFYARAFGFEPKTALPGPDGKIIHGESVWRNILIMYGPEGSCDKKAPATSGVPSPMGLYVYCDDVEALFARATAAGATVVSGLDMAFWGDRMCTLRDPDGYEWSFATNVEEFDPSKVPH
jgi:uncharacterized glyoxalase superfamily protein PhnB